MSVTQQEIDIGAVANDGTGESLRDAFNAVNNNFANVWAAGPVGTNVVVRNNEVTTSVTNLDLKIAGNGVGNVVVASTLQPTIDGVYDLGRPGKQWGEVHGQYFYGNGAFLTGVGTEAISIINANGVILSGNANTEVTFLTGNNLSIVANADISTAVFSVDDNPVFANVIASQATLGNIVVANNTITTDIANSNVVLSPNGTGVVESTANISAPYFLGNIVGNVTGNISLSGYNTGVVFNDSGQANSVAGFAFDKTANVLSVAGNINGSDINAAGYGLQYVIADRGGDTTNWNALMQMGTYTVNRVNWGGVTGAPLDSNVYVGMLEVKAANTQGSVISVEQSFYPGEIDDYTNVKIQYNRSYWAGVWTPWIKITNDGQKIDGGSF